MLKNSMLTEIRKGKTLISDGAWGTLLIEKGLKSGECPELWNINRINDVKKIAEDYILAGADMVKTNSFGGNIFKLKHFGLGDKVFEINVNAAKASRIAAGENHFVLGSIGPTGKMLITGEVTEDELYNAFKEQAAALESGEANAALIETMSDIDEAVCAIKAVKENTALEVICTFSFEKTLRGDYRTMMGISPDEMAKACVKANADIIGANCGGGFSQMIDIVKEIRTTAPDTPILVHANAGLPVMINNSVTYPETPSDMAALVPKLIQAGANIIGGCCGTTPDHITAIKSAMLSM